MDAPQEEMPTRQVAAGQLIAATMTEEPTSTSTSTPTATSIATPTPIYTSTATATSTPTSTPTATPAPTSTDVLTATPTPAPTFTATSEPAPVYTLEALSPNNGEQFHGWNAEVILVAQTELPSLADDEWVVFRVPYGPAEHEVAEFWRKRLTFELPKNFSDANVGFADRRYTWSVKVMKCTSNCDKALDDNIKKEGIIKLFSGEAYFYWNSDFQGSNDEKPAPTRIIPPMGTTTPPP